MVKMLFNLKLYGYYKRSTFCGFDIDGHSEGHKDHNLYFLKYIYDKFLIENKVNPVTKTSFSQIFE